MSVRLSVVPVSLVYADGPVWYMPSRDVFRGPSGPATPSVADGGGGGGSQLKLDLPSPLLPLVTRLSPSQ